MNPVPGSKIPTDGILAFRFQRSPTHVHQGVDLVAPIGARVVAAEGGRVLKCVTGYTPGFRGYGRCVVIWSPSSGRFYLYGHLDSIAVSEGQEVKAGDPIGTVGKTAWRTEELEDLTTGPHLHFEVSRTPYPKKPEATRLDPVLVLRVLEGKGTIPGAAGSIFGLVLLLALAFFFYRTG